jgi:ubiquitin-conjugating enzyme E2 J1
MDTDAKGQLGGIECSRDARERMAKESGAWKCAGCGKSNTEIMQEREEMVKEIEEKEGKRKDEEVPEELRLAYRDELGQKDGDQEKKVDKGKGKAVESPAEVAPADSPSVSVAAAPVTPTTRPAPVAPMVRPTRTVPAPPLQRVAQRSPDLAWIDTCIYGVVAALLFMVVKRFV